MFPSLLCPSGNERPTTLNSIPDPIAQIKGQAGGGKTELKWANILSFGQKLSAAPGNLPGHRHRPEGKLINSCCCLHFLLSAAAEPTSHASTVDTLHCTALHCTALHCRAWAVPRQVITLTVMGYNRYTGIQV